MTKNILKFVCFLTLSLLIYSCGNSKYSKIESLEDELYGAEEFIFNEEKATQLLDAYISFADEFPEDTLAPICLYKGGELAMSLSQFNKSISLFTKLINNYNRHSKTSTAIFMKAFIFENHLSNLEMAKKNYQIFIKNYPKHPLAKDAEASLQNLGKPLEEIIRSFEEKNKTEQVEKKSGFEPKE